VFARHPHSSLCRRHRFAPGRQAVINRNGGFDMTKKALALLLLASVCPLSAAADDNLVKFEGAVGVHPVANTGVVNTVRGVPPGGRPWGIQKLKATVKTDGRISATGEGLVLGGTDAAGTRGGVLQVAATLFCDASNNGFSSPAADLSVGGDFDIRGTLTDTTGATPPNPCTTPTLLIRNATGGVLANWFAAGTFAD
jgi:hypothetical protein